MLVNSKVFADTKGLLEPYRKKIINTCVNTNKSIDVYNKNGKKISGNKKDDICRSFVDLWFQEIYYEVNSHLTSLDLADKAMHNLAEQVIPLYLNTSKYYNEGYFKSPEAFRTAIDGIVYMINISIEQNNCQFFREALHCSE